MDKEFKAILGYIIRGQPGLLETLFFFFFKKKTLIFPFHAEHVPILLFAIIPQCSVAATCIRRVLKVSLFIFVLIAKAFSVTGVAGLRRCLRRQR